MKPERWNPKPTDETLVLAPFQTQILTSKEVMGDGLSASHIRSKVRRKTPGVAEGSELPLPAPIADLVMGYALDSEGLGHLERIVARTVLSRLEWCSARGARFTLPEPRDYWEEYEEQ